MDQYFVQANMQNKIGKTLAHNILNETLTGNIVEIHPNLVYNMFGLPMEHHMYSISV